ncbi:MAG: hypothetical protein IPL62_19995 [Caulobacteraceae bacterium]|nr:hypothetical protein [Caulobacteraceae bacterium]
MFGAVKAQIALAERRIDEPAMVRLGLAPVAVRDKIAAGHAHALPRNGAFTLQGVNRADDDTEQRRLILCAEDASLRRSSPANDAQAPGRCGSRAA